MFEKANFDDSTITPSQDDLCKRGHTKCRPGPTIPMLSGSAPIIMHLIAKPETNEARLNLIDLFLELDTLAC